ncbi:hypothetical protein [Arcticibacter sp.]|uniref:hypothetical protein n=1 Tax=Arcticibacter sp. TaxID=1872630 RepID=UPI00388EF871
MRAGSSHGSAFFVRLAASYQRVGKWRAGSGRVARNWRAGGQQLGGNWWAAGGQLVGVATT